MLIKDIKTNEAKSHISNPNAHISFSQFGEDLVILSILGMRKRLETGFYVDVGAFHPFKHSNTALLHLFHGWKGINIDANPDSIQLFEEQRPGDVNIVAAVSDEEAEREYLRFDHSGVNTLDPGMQQRQTRDGSPFKVKDRVMVRTRGLKDILDGLAEPPARIDFLNVDCEGLDLRVLRSNDWNRYRPRVIAVEALGLKLEKSSDNPLNVFLRGKGYRLVSHAFVTSIFVGPSE